MESKGAILEYNCPSCGGGLVFSENAQRMRCPYCENEYDLETVEAYNEASKRSDSTVFSWENASQAQMSEEEQSKVRSFICQSCGGELMTDHVTAATFCPYCDNPVVLPNRLSGTVRPDGVIPFQLTKEDAKSAFLKLCKGKPLLPKLFTQQNRIEKITGMYVPFWLYDCDSDFDGRYKATRVSHWSDSDYHYTKTDHFLLHRGCVARFADIPMDASTKIDDTVMESIEPYDYSKMVGFNTAYLSGFLADTYDVESKAGEDRIRQRIGNSIDDLVAQTCIGYASCIPTSKTLQIDHGKASYVLLPVWLLHTKYKDKTYAFAMNGQTGKLTGTLPICPKRTAAWFAGICAAVTAVAALVQTLLL